MDFIRGSDWGGGIGGILYSMRGGSMKFDHYDGRGDVATQTNGTGTVTYQANYEAWGTRTAEFGSDQDRQRANTKEEDPTGLLDEGMRYRDLEAGSFITRDPAGFIDGPNLYTYVRQNPWTKFDPEGLASEEFTKNHPWLTFISRMARGAEDTMMFAATGDAQINNPLSPRAYIQGQPKGWTPSQWI